LEISQKWKEDAKKPCPSSGSVRRPFSVVQKTELLRPNSKLAAQFFEIVHIEPTGSNR
jgi:hypothetical protein